MKLQEKINVLFADAMRAAEFGSDQAPEMADVGPGRQTMGGRIVGAYVFNALANLKRRVDVVFGDSDRNVLKERVDKALEIADSYAQIDGDHHKLWVIDQMVRALLGSDAAYAAWVDMHCGTPNEDGETDYSWETGTPP